MGSVSSWRSQEFRDADHRSSQYHRYQQDLDAQGLSEAMHVFCERESSQANIRVYGANGLIDAFE